MSRREAVRWHEGTKVDFNHTDVRFPGGLEAFIKGINAAFGQNCKSGRCTPDLALMSNICGRVKTAFKDGTSCLDGKRH
jgi:hypothetical protein